MQRVRRMLNLAMIYCTVLVCTRIVLLLKCFHGLHNWVEETLSFVLTESHIINEVGKVAKHTSCPLFTENIRIKKQMNNRSRYINSTYLYTKCRYAECHYANSAKCYYSNLKFLKRHSAFQRG